MSRLLSLAAATVAELGPADTVTAAADAGFDGAGLWFDPERWTPAVTSEVRRRLDANGVIAWDMEPVIIGPEGDPGDALVDAAAAVGARHVLVASRLAEPAAVTTRFAELCARAAPAGIVVVLEFLPIFGIASMADALGVVAAADQPNAGVLVDALHLARSGGAPAALASVPAHRLPYVQVCDAPTSPPDPSMAGLLDEALHGRLLPGEGDLPLAELVAAVPGAGLSAELRSRSVRTRWPDPTERARAVAQACRPLTVLAPRARPGEARAG